MFPVTALYALEPESDYLEAALLTVLQVPLVESQSIRLHRLPHYSLNFVPQNKQENTLFD